MTTILEAATLFAADRVQPCDKNPRCGQFKGRPVLLLGGSKTDHIFLAEGLKKHLDKMVAAAANCVRSMMNQREDNDLKPHRRLERGKVDHNQWNEKNWQWFADCQRWCHERDIIIQIEVRDRFGFSREHWEISPSRPQNNVNYTSQNTG